MSQYIDKAAVVVEIEKLQKMWKQIKTRNEYEDGLKTGRLIGYKDALYKLNSIKVKEVDLEKEIQSWVEDNSVNGYYREDVYETANHFFELGLNARKEK